MSRFTTKSAPTKTVNLAGGQAYRQNPQLELISLLITSFANDQYYKSSKDSFENLIRLIGINDKKFAAKAAIYARREFGMRSITHVLTSEIAKHISGAPWAARFYESIVYRVDDMTEILAYHISKGEKLPKAMQKGFARAFDKFDGYQLAKYKNEGKSFKLVDVVNLIHPKPTEKNAEALRLLTLGKLSAQGTWEAELTRATQNVEDEQEKQELKAEVWRNLVSERKIGYFALLRNLRNILRQAPDILSQALEMLTDERLIKKSLVLPFRYMTAIKEIKQESNSRDVIVALNKAVEISLNNVPKLDGKTLIVLDVSGSMMSYGTRSGYSPAEIGALFGAVLYKTNDSDFMVFSDDAGYVNLNPMDSVLSIAGGIPFKSGGTNFHSIFHRANRAYDRIVILSDMQGWVGYTTPVADFNEYKSRLNANPMVYSFDLQGYGSMQFPQNDVVALAGFSDKVFDIMKLLETDKNALINKINSIEI